MLKKMDDAVVFSAWANEKLRDVVEELREYEDGGRLFHIYLVHMVCTHFWNHCDGTNLEELSEEFMNSVKKHVNKTIESIGLRSSVQDSTKE